MSASRRLDQKGASVLAGLPGLADAPLVASSRALSVRFWGVRGSYPATGSEMLAFGGATPCVEVRLGTRLFVVDAGTGIAALGRSPPMQHSEQIDLLLSHLHHDHVMGLPFFPPLLTAGVTVTAHVGNLGGRTAEADLAGLFSPPVFPITLDHLPGRIAHVGFQAGDTLRFDDGIAVRTCPLRHPGGATGYRFDHEGAALCYVSDIEHDEEGPAPALVEFVRGADLVIYDAMFTPEQYRRCQGWGHSTWQAGVDLCRAAGARRLAAFHHDPVHTDAKLAALEVELAAALPGSFFSRQGVSVLVRAPGDT